MDDLCAVLDNLGLFVEEINYFGSEDQGGNRHYDERYCRKENGYPDSLFGSRCVTFTEVLAYKGRGCNGDRVRGEENYRLELAVHRDSGHKILAEGVDIRSNEHTGKAADRGLYCRGQTDRDYFFQKRTVKTEIFDA